MRNIFGIHTMIDSGDDIDLHLDWASAMVGPQGYVKQLIGPFTSHVQEPPERWCQIIDGIYDRNMIPIIRVAGEYVRSEQQDGYGGASYWKKPDSGPDGSYSEIARAVARGIAGLPRRRDCPMYVEVFNEPNLKHEWSGKAPEPAEYGRLLVAVSDELRRIDDPGLIILPGALSPGGDYNNLSFLRTMLTEVPETLTCWDVWASHPYPANHPPEYNNHDKTARFGDFTIDSYLLELAVVAEFGRTDVGVIATETGWKLGDDLYRASEGYPPVTERMQADFYKRAFVEYWPKWPEVIAVCPFELCSVNAGPWEQRDLVHPDSLRDARGRPTNPRPAYSVLADLPKPHR